MKHIRTFESYKNKKKTEDIINEAVLKVNDIFKVKTIADVPQSLINSYVKKVKDTTGNKLGQFYSEEEIAELIVKMGVENGLNVDQISPGALMGGQEEIQDQVQPQAQTQVQVQTEVQPQGDEEDDLSFEDDELQSQVQDEDNEELPL